MSHRCPHISLTAERVRVLERFDNGGGIVEIPVATPAKLILSKIHSGGQGTFDFDDQFFDQVVENVRRQPDRVRGVFRGHMDRKERIKKGSEGIVLSAFKENGKLWNRLFLKPTMFHDIVDNQSFYSASIEVELDDETATGVQLTGWTQTGLAIANNAACDDLIYVAAERDDAQRLVRLCVTTVYDRDKKEQNAMDEKEKQELLEKIKTIEAAAKTATDRGETLAGELKKITAERDELKKIIDASKDKDKEVASLRAELNEIKASAETSKRALFERDVCDALNDAVMAGKLTPAQIEGYKEKPAEVFEKLGFKDVTSFKAFMSKAPTVVKIGATTVGGGPTGSVTPTGSVEERMNAAVTKLAAERKIAKYQAMELMATENPELYQEFSRSRATKHGNS